MSAAINILKMKKEDVPKFLAAGTWLCYINLNNQKKINIHIVNLKSTWEKHLLAAWASTDPGSQADNLVLYPCNTATMLY